VAAVTIPLAFAGIEEDAGAEMAAELGVGG